MTGVGLEEDTLPAPQISVHLWGEVHNIFYQQCAFGRQEPKPSLTCLKEKHGTLLVHESAYLEG